MIDDNDMTGTAAPQPDASAPEPPLTPEPDPWREVLDGFEALGSAIGRWAKSVVDDPENRRRAQQLKEQLAGVARDLGVAADNAAEKIRTAAEKREQQPDDTQPPQATPPEGDRTE